MSASQDVSIMAADPTQFNDVIIAADEIYEKFALEFPEGTLLRTEGHTVDGELALHYGTRYFTVSKISKGETSLKLDSSIDPFGILGKAIGTRGKHLSDNKVRYYNRTDMGEGKKAKYVRI